MNNFNSDYADIIVASGLVSESSRKRIEDQTLHEAIASRGWTSQKETDVQRRTIYNENGERLGSFTAFEAWGYLRQNAN